MKIQSLILASMLSLVGSATFFNAAFADTPNPAVSVTANCNDGTLFTGTTKKGACSGHKGVKDWAEDKASAVTENKSVVAEKSSPAKSAKEITAAKPAVASTMSQAPGGAGKVWVNTKSKTYHCQGTAYYGKTKVGAYMTEAEAKTQGNHADHGKTCS